MNNEFAASVGADTLGAVGTTDDADATAAAEEPTLSYDERQFLALLDYLKQNRGFDFSGYKRSSLVRRVHRRMQTLAITQFEDYVDYLEVHPDEFAQLFNMILINVTGFFRDPDTWKYIAEEVIPALLSQKTPSETIRIWSAGCASGEETYTLAILLAEALGFEDFRRRVKIYATDIDDEALTQARQASYSARDVANIPPPLLGKYFEHATGRYVFHKDLRRAVIFGRNDLLKDAPISRVDLLTCRNTMMYFNAEVQGQVLQRFHFALSDAGYLFLGKAEMLFTHGNLFTPIELKRRVFSKVLKGVPRDRNALITASAAVVIPENVQNQLRVREQVFDLGTVAQMVIGENGSLALANDQVRTMFRLGTHDIGRLLQDLELSYRPVDLRSCIDSAYADRRTVELKEVIWQAAGALEPVFLDIRVQPLFDSERGILGASITFTDVTRYKRLQQELEEANRELETAYEELQSTNEELETTNEELQSTNEELETTNEELQSTNEELETINEELHSTNEELQNINEELHTRSSELNYANAFLSSILASLRGGVIVLNRDLHITIWNHKAEDLWGLRSDEVRDKHLLNLDIGLPVEELRAPLRACLAGQRTNQELTLPATNRRGRTIQCKITCTALAGGGDEIMGAILVMEE